MTQTPSPPPTGPIMTPPDLPGATAGLVFGILSIVFSAPVIGLLLGFLGLQKSREAKQIAELNPGVYSNLGVAQAGFVCSIVGMVLGVISSLCGCGWFLVVIVAIVGAAAGQGGGP